MTPEIQEAWREFDDMLCDAIADHGKRRAIQEKLADIRTAEMLEWSGKVERRLAMDKSGGK